MVNSVLYRDFRLSVLTPGLFRIEKSKEKAFHGNKTQLVDFRDFDAVPFTSEEKNGELILRTEKAELHFTGSIPTSYFLSHRKKIFLNNDQNLGGTYSNLDGMDGAVRLYGLADSYPGVGVCSRNGVALLDDSRSYCLNEKEEVTVRNPDEKDVYVFFFPEDYEEAVRTFFRLSGVSPLLPRYVFGNWWSRFYNYTQESYLYQMEQFKEENVPFTVATVDMNWHPSNTNGRNFFQDVGRDVSEFYHKDKSGREVSYCQGFGKPTDWIIGWTGYSFNKPLFPDYQRFLKDLHALGLHVTLNIHPANGIAFFEDQYGKCCEDLGLDPKKKESIPFNVLDPKLLKDYEDNILHPYEKDGVDFWWYDWQQGNQSALPGLNMLWAINHYLYWDRARQTDRPVILSRYCGLGGQRYPIGFSGDTFQSFATLRYLVKTTSMASNIGFPYWSHDIGGHQQGHKDGDLYLKFVQFAVFSPILRLHCSSEEMLSKNPDLFLGGYGELVKRYLRLRQSLIPYLDSENYHINAEGETLLRPLYYSYPKDEKAYSYAEKEYFFGKDLLVAPFFTPEDKDGFTSEKIYLPEGEYVDPVYGYSYAGKKELKVYRERGEMALFLKKGAFLILDGRKEGNDLDNPPLLQVLTSRGEGSYDFAEEKDGSPVFTLFSGKEKDGTYVLSLKTSGSLNAFLPKRIYSIEILDVISESQVKAEGATILSSSLVSGHLIVRLSGLTLGKEARISITATEDSLAKLKHDLSLRLGYLDGLNNLRNLLYRSIQKAHSRAAISLAITRSGLSLRDREALKELL